MASTRLVRKAKKNRSVSKRRVNTFKRLTSKPVIKNVDIEQIKEEFAKKPAKAATKKEEAPVKEAPVAEPKAEKKEEPKAEAAPEKEEKAPVKKEKAEAKEEPKVVPTSLLIG